MKHPRFALAAQILFLITTLTRLTAGDPPSTTLLFPDPNLEAAVRKMVFEKRDNDKPLVESDVVNLSVLEARGAGITNLAGLEKCRGLAAIDLSRNRIVHLHALKPLNLLQSLTLSDNQITDLDPLSGLVALQYLEVSRNRIRTLGPVGSLTNLSALYVSSNQVVDVSPLLKLRKLSSLYLDQNQIKTLPGFGGLSGLFSLSLAGNHISDLTSLGDLNGVYNLFLENNRIRDLAPLVARVQSDKEHRFAPFLKLYLKGNPLSSHAKREQLNALKEAGVRLGDL